MDRKTKLASKRQNAGILDLALLDDNFGAINIPWYGYQVFCKRLDPGFDVDKELEKIKNMLWDLKLQEEKDKENQ